MAAISTTELERGTRVFISYSRKDGAFADRLRDALIARRFEAYLDRHDIAPGEPWQERLAGLITNADAVVICMSPNFVASPVCDWEVNEAERLGKRVLPVVAAATPDADAPQRLKRLNYIFLRHDEEFESGLQKLDEALSTDLAWVREHTRLGERVREWRNGGEKAAALLRGEQIGLAEAWIAGRPREAPEITQDIAQFVAQSRMAETAQQKRARRRSRIVAGASLAAALVTGGLGWMMYGQWLEAQSRQSLTLANYADQQVARGDAVVGMLLALEALPDGRSLHLLERLRPLVPEAGVSLSRAFHAGAGRWSLTGHARKVTAAGIGPDGSYVATASEDGTARIWNVSTGQQHAVLVGHHGPIGGLAFSPDGRLLATGSADRTVRIWDWQSLTARTTLVGHRAEVERVAFDRSGTRLLSVAKDSSVRVWSLATGEVLLETTNDNSFGKPLPFSQVLFAPDGSLLTVGGVSNDVARLWDAASGYAPRELLKHEAGGAPGGSRTWSTVRIGPDGTRAAVTRGGRLQLIDTASGAAIGAVNAAAIWRAEFSADGSRLAVATKDAETWRVNVLDAQSGQWLCATPAEKGSVPPLAFDAKGQRLLMHPSISEKNVAQALSAWDASTCLHLVNFKSRAPPTAELRAIEPSTENFVVSGSGSRMVSWSPLAVGVWSVESGEPTAVVGVDQRGYSWAHATLDPAGRTAVVFDKGESRLDVFDAATGRHLRRIEGHGDRYAPPMYAPDGKRLVTFDDRVVTVWDAHTWTKVGAPLNDNREIYAVTLSGDGRHALVQYKAAPEDPSAEEDNLGEKVARLGRAVALDDGREVALRAGEETRHWAQLSSPDGKRDYRQLPGRNAEILDVESGEAIADLGGHFGAVTLSADKRRLVTAGDKTATVWEFATGRRISEIKGASEWIFLNLAIDREGRRIVTGPNFAGASGAVGTGPDGRLLASDRDRPKALWLWDAGTGERIKALEGHTDSIVHNGMSPNGSRLITVSSDGTARIWRLETGALDGVLDLVDAFGERDVDLASSAAFDAGGERVLTWTKSGATFWRLFPSAGALVDAIRAAVPRCLTAEERRAFFLSATVPRWCYARKKWPYHDPAAAPPPYTLDERVLLVWGALGGDAALAALSRTFDRMSTRQSQ
jgi:WD40 repeat protein